MTKAVGVVSDLHCGSIFGLLPPGFITSAGDERNLNPGQIYLWQCWLKIGEWFAANKVSAVVVNGDVIDGEQHAQRGTELCLNILKDQLEAAAITLEKLREFTGPIPYFFIQGTEYHDLKAGQGVDAVAERLGAIPYKAPGTGRFSREMLDLDVDGVITNFLHGISVSSGLYRATAPDREALWSALAGKEGKSPRADCVIRSHAHYFIHLEHPSKHAVITPAMQLPTRYMRKNSAYRMMPDIGAIIEWINPEAKKAGGDPIQIQKLLFPLPAIKPTRLPE